MNTGKLLIMLLLLNFTMGMGLELSEQLDTGEWVRSETSTEALYEIRNSYDEDLTKWGTIKGSTTQVQETSYGNSLKMGSLIWDGFQKSVKILPIEVYEDNPTMNAIAWSTNFFLLILKAFIGYQVFLILKNRKTT